MRPEITSALAAAVLTASTCATPVLLNGDLNGTVGQFIAPDNWTISQATPDVADANGPFNNTGMPWTLSPNGGTFARLNGVRDNRSERIAQMVSGFVIGNEYQIRMFVTNLGFYGSDNVFRGEDGIIQAFSGNVLIGASQVVSKPAAFDEPIVWHEAVITFFAPAETINLRIGAETLGSIGVTAYMGVDGISIVPAPATLAVLLPLASRRRRT